MTKSTEVLLALAVESRERVDGMMKLVLDFGGSEAREPQDHGWMYAVSRIRTGTSGRFSTWRDRDAAGSMKIVST